MALLRDVPAKVNLIQYNENPGLGFHSTLDNRAERFRAHPRSGGTWPPSSAQNRGRDIAAACGQLANVDARNPAKTGMNAPVEPAGDGATLRIP